MTEKQAKPKAKSTSAVGKPPKATAKMAAEKKETSSNGDWRAETLEQIRRLIHEVDPAMVEERKWKKPSNPAGVPVWSHGGIVCTGETYKAVVKLTFMRGASLPDPRKLFNASLEGNARRAIDIHEGESLDPKAFKALIKAAVAENLGSANEKSKTGTKEGAKGNAATKPKPNSRNNAAKKDVVLLAGGNPQIAKAEGDAPVQAYIAAIPVGWKRDIAKRLDTLIQRQVPNAQKAVKWNSPFYGIEGQGWFASFHVFTKYVKLTFFKGASLRNAPTGGTGKDARWIDIHENDFDETQLATWIKQAAAMPGWLP